MELPWTLPIQAENESLITLLATSRLKCGETFGPALGIPDIHLTLLTFSLRRSQVKTYLSPN